MKLNRSVVVDFAPLGALAPTLVSLHLDGIAVDEGQLLAFTAAAADNGGLRRLRNLHLAGALPSTMRLDACALALGPIAPSMTSLSLEGGGDLSAEVAEELMESLEQLEVLIIAWCCPEAEQFEHQRCPTPRTALA